MVFIRGKKLNVLTMLWQIMIFLMTGFTQTWIEWKTLWIIFVAIMSWTIYLQLRMWSNLEKLQIIAIWPELNNVKDTRICFLIVVVLFFLTNLHKNHFSRSNLTQAKHSLYNIVYILIVSWNEKILRLKAVRFLCSLVLRKTLLLCGDAEENPEPFNTSNLSTFDKKLDPSQKCLKFFSHKCA